jgi:hypothetical protein
VSAAPQPRARPRRRLRRRLLLVGVLPSLLALLVAVRLGGMVVWNEQGREAWAERHARAAAGLFARNQVAAPVERWVAPFNEGGALALGDDLRGARASLQKSLAVVPPRHECLVRLNLALVLEALGDRAARAGPTRAMGSWTEGRAVIAVDGCDAADAVDTRLEQKLARLREQQAAQAQPPRRTPEQRRDADRLERLNDGAAAEERDLREREGSGPPGESVEW